MLMSTGTMGVAMRKLVGGSSPDVHDLNVEGQRLARQRVVGVDIGAVPAHLQYFNETSMRVLARRCGYELPFYREAMNGGTGLEAWLKIP